VLNAKLQIKKGREKGDGSGLCKQRTAKFFLRVGFVLGAKQQLNRAVWQWPM